MKWVKYLRQDNTNLVTHSQSKKPGTLPAQNTRLMQKISSVRT